MAQTHVYHWKHGWIPLTHAAALSKAHGNHKLAERYVPSTPAQKARKTPQHVLDYHAARQQQNARFENKAGAGISVQDTHTQEYKDYFGVGDHSTSSPVEERVTFKTHLRNLAASKHDINAHEHSYNAGVELGRRHHAESPGAATENAQYDKAVSKVDHEDDFGQGYADGVTAAYEEHSQGPAPIATRRDLAGAILALPDTPNQQAAKKRITEAAQRLNATDLLPKPMQSGKPSYDVGGKVEVLRPNFAKQGFPEEWASGTITHTTALDSGHKDITVEINGVKSVERIGKNGGNRRVRPAKPPVNAAAVINHWRASGLVDSESKQAAIERLFKQSRTPARK